MTNEKKFEDKYKDTDILQKIKKSDMSGMKEAIKEYLRSYGVIEAPLACIIRKAITMQTCDDFLLYATSDDEMITRMLYFPSDKNKVNNKQSAQSVTEHPR